MSARHRKPGLLGRLGDLDDRVVPGAAARVQGVADGLAEARRRARAAARGELPPPTSGTGGLARLDARLARRGPLAALRAVPLAGAALAAALALAGGLAAASLGGTSEDRLAVAGATSRPEGAAAGATASRSTSPTPSPAATAEAPGAPAPGAAPAAPPAAAPAPAPAPVIGPADGALVADHVAAAAAELARLGAEAPATPVPALVHLTEHSTPQRAADLVSGVPALRAVVRVPLPGEQTAVTPVPAQQLPDDLIIALPGLAQQLRSRAVADEAAAAGSPPGDPGGDALRASASLARRQADLLDAGPSCACTVAVLVVGTPGELAPLAARPGVRAVEAGPAGSPPEQLALRPLLPEQTVTVAPAGAS